MHGKQSIWTFWHRAAGLWFLTAVIFAGLLAMTGSITTPVYAAGSQATYIVLHQAPPLAGYQGSIAGLAATAPFVTGSSRLDSDSVASINYLNYLARQQAQLLTTMEMTLGRPLDVLFQYNAVLNGLAVRLAPSEAATVAALPGVARVVRDYDRYLLTDAGPEWIGANSIWNGSSTGGLPGSRGEGVVVGVIDTGINHDHPSFADVGPVDGYNHTNPKGRFFGVCDPVLGVPFCNDKLIGVYDFTGTSPQDDNGHGSHTASTAAGNVVNAALIAPTTTVNRTISGVAPHANIIAYKACVTTPALGTCPISALIAAINQATLDEVDVINYSIGGGSSDPWSDLDAQAFFNARNAGIFVATSAGNSGPGAATIGSPADAPWVLSVGASTHNRKFVNALVNMNGGAATPPADIEGKSVTAGYGPAPIVYAGDYGNNLCGSGPAEAPLNPFPPGTFDGEIVVCDRGTYARVDKARFVGEAGAGGFVLANDEANGDSLVGDPYAIPGVHITYDDGVVLKAWTASGAGHVATITGTTADENAGNGDVMASFSSRGPNPAAASIIKPDITAPGVDILAAFHTPAGSTATDPEYGVISGTSMSSPHAAGAAALIRALHPDWTPDEVKSALMTSAFTTLPGNGSETHDVLKEDAATPADPFDMGAGRIDLAEAARVGLVLDETAANYEAANPANGGDPRTLNLTSLADADCAGVCTWTRVVASTQSTSVNWTAATVTSAGVTLSVAPSRFTLEPGATQTITITAGVTDATANRWHFAEVTLVPDSPAVPNAHLPVAILAKGGITVPRTALYFHGNLHDGCTGDGRADLVECEGPFLRPDPILDDNLAAHWGPVTPGVSGAADRNIYDPNWVWNLDGLTTVEGPMTVEWWAACGGCSSGLLSADWFIRLWADGVNVFEQRVTATPAVPNLPTRLETTVILPEVTANNTFVLHIDPVYIDSQQNTFIYYDSAQACPGASEGQCDSLVLMPITSEPDVPVGGGHGTGGGWLATSGGDKLNFGFQVEQVSEGPEGDLQLRDKAAGVKIDITEITAIGSVIAPCGGVSAGDNAIEFRGSGTYNGDPATFRACVQDNAEPGNSSANPDLFYLACLSGCDYDTGTHTPDAGLDGGNIKVHVSPTQPTNQPTTQTSLLASDSASASVLILNPLLLSEAGIDTTLTLEVAAYDAAGEPMSDVTVTLEQTAAGGDSQTFTALTGVDGLALFTITVLGGEVEYIAYDNNLSSNAMNVVGILP